jgi:hypothetical protein
MADLPPYSSSSSNTGDDTVSTPRWVKVFGIIALVVVLLFLIMMFTRGPGGGHGPSRHIRSGDTGGQTPLSSITEHDIPAKGGHG